MKIPLNQLKHDPNAIRKVKADNLDKLIASIQSRDLLHNLVVVKNGSGYHVIDGNRRLDALIQIHGKESIEEIDCKVVNDNTDEIGLHANMMREGMHPLDECDVINKLCQDGTEDYDSIAKRFGHTNKWVEQRVALSDLIPAIKKVFRNCEMNLGTASLFTKLKPEQQKVIFKECDGDYEYGNINWKINNSTLQKKDIIIPKTHALYNEIEFTGDLFSDRQYAADTQKALEIQKQWVDEKIQYYSKRFEKVHYLGDTQLYEDEGRKIVKNLTKEFDSKTYKDCDLQLTVHYNPLRSEFYIQKWLDKTKASQKEIDAVENGEVPDLTLADMSNPQHDEMIQMQFHALRNAINVGHKPDHTWMVGYFCGILFTPYSRVSASPVEPRFENSLIEPNCLFANELAEVIAELTSWKEKNPDRQAAHFFINKGYTYSVRALYLRFITSMDSYDTNQFNQEFAKIKLQDDWFKPDYNWIKKYKTKQLYLLADKMKIDVTPTMKKLDIVEAIVGGFRSGKTFDPIQFMKDIK